MYCPDVLTRDAFAPTTQSPPCAECPLTLLDEYLASERGRLIKQVFDLEFALQAGITITLKEIRYTEFLLLRQLAEERGRYQEEKIRKDLGKHGSQ